MNTAVNGNNFISEIQHIENGIYFVKTITGTRT